MNVNSTLDRLGEYTPPSLQATPRPRTKAELTASLSLLGDRLARPQKQHAVRLCTDVAYCFSGCDPTLRPSEAMLLLQAERVRNLGKAPSAFQLLEARHQLLADQTSKVR